MIVLEFELLVCHVLNILFLHSMNLLFLDIFLITCVIWCRRAVHVLVWVELSSWSLYVHEQLSSSRAQWCLRSSRLPQSVSHRQVACLQSCLPNHWKRALHFVAYSTVSQMQFADGTLLSAVDGVFGGRCISLICEVYFIEDVFVLSF